MIAFASPGVLGAPSPVPRDKFKGGEGKRVLENKKINGAPRKQFDS